MRKPLTVRAAKAINAGFSSPNSFAADADKRAVAEKNTTFTAI